MTKIENSNGELLKELQKLQERHNSLKSLYNKHLHKRKILQELSRERNEKLSESNALLEIAKEKTKEGGGDFENFCLEYPNKIGKSKSLEKFTKAVKKVNNQAC